MASHWYANCQKCKVKGTVFPHEIWDTWKCRECQQLYTLIGWIREKEDTHPEIEIKNDSQ